MEQCIDCPLSLWKERECPEYVQVRVKKRQNCAHAGESGKMGADW